jgi:hypothetical protein
MMPCQLEASFYGEAQVSDVTVQLDKHVADCFSASRLGKPTVVARYSNAVECERDEITILLTKYLGVYYPSRGHRNNSILLE